MIPPTPASRAFWSNGTISSLVEKLKTQEKRPENSLVMSILGRSAQTLDSGIRCLDLWTAFEISAGGNKAARRAVDTARRGTARHKAIDDLKKARDRFIHNGIRPNIDHSQERIIAAEIFNNILSREGLSDSEIDSILAQKI